jgi:molybdate-binding protein/DNA-binding XRE family transcriptional regulator
MTGRSVDPGRTGTRLRLARLARGLSQAQLADMAGVTRQAVTGIEAGRWDPSLRVALALSRGLSLDVEDLFGSPPDLPAVEARTLGAVPEDGVPVVLAKVGDAPVALPLLGDRALRPGFGNASGAALPATVPGRATVIPIGSTWRSVVVAGCDPGLPLLAEPLARLSPPIGLAWWPCSTERALELAASGLVHVAGVHLPDSDPGLSALVGRHLGDRGAEVIGFTGWHEGLVWDRSLATALDLTAAFERGLRLVNREPGSEARSLLEAEADRGGLPLAAMPGSHTAVTAHLLVTSAIASGLGAVGVSTEPCAIAHGLGFTPLASEHSHLVVPAPLLATPEIQGLLRVLADADLRNQLARLEGYDARLCGDPILTVARGGLPPAADPAPGRGSRPGVGP